VEHNDKLFVVDAVRLRLALPLKPAPLPTFAAGTAAHLRGAPCTAVW